MTYTEQKSGFLPSLCHNMILLGNLVFSKRHHLLPTCSGEKSRGQPLILSSLTLHIQSIRILWYLMVSSLSKYLSGPILLTVSSTFILIQNTIIVYQPSSYSLLKCYSFHPCHSKSLCLSVKEISYTSHHYKEEIKQSPT